MQDEPTETQIDDLIAKLGALRDDEVQPRRDLWPAIDMRTRRRRLMRTLMQVAAAIAIFVAGLAIGRYQRAPVTAASERADIAVQHKGSEFVSAVAAISHDSDERLRLKGREVALSALYGVLYELDRAGDDDRLPEAMRLVARHRDETARRVERATIRF